MAIKMVDRKWCPCVTDYKKSFVMDSAEDAANLPECCPGSTAIVAAKDGGMYMVNASGEWEEL
jgi:hypothetical protein